SSSWYPVAWYRQLHAAARSVCHAGPELPRQLAREATRADFKGVFRFAASVVSARIMLGRLGMFWRMYWDGGDVKLISSDGNSAQIRCENCVGFNRDIWEDLLGSGEALLDLTGARDITAVITSGGGSGDANAECRYTWTP